MHHGGARERLHARQPQRDALRKRHTRAEVLLVLDRLGGRERDVERAHSGRGPADRGVEGRRRRGRGGVSAGRRLLGGRRGSNAQRDDCDDSDGAREEERAASTRLHRRLGGAAASSRDGHDGLRVSRERETR